MTNSGKALQEILQRVADNADKPRRFDDPNNHQQIQSILDNQKLMSQALLIIGLTLDTIIDEQLEVYIAAPAPQKRS